MRKREVGHHRKVFALTERGEKFLNHSSIKQFPSVEDVRQLEARIDELSTQVEDLEDQQRKMNDAYNQMADLVEELQEKVDDS